MRSHVSSRAAAAVVCGVLALGTAGTAVAATAHRTPAGVGAEAARAPITDAESLKQQTQALRSMADAIEPVTDLLDAVVAADNGQISAADVQRHQKAIKRALDSVKKAAQAAPAKPANNMGNLGNMDAVNAVGADHKSPAAANLTVEAVASVQKTTDALLKATATKDANAVATRSKAVVRSLVNLATALYMNGGLPAPNLPGMPVAPKLPDAEAPTPAPELPGVPSTPKRP